MIEVTAEVVRELLDYNPETGEFRWKERSKTLHENDHARTIFNARRAGKSAGYERSDGYREIEFFNKSYLAHRLAWLYVYGEWPNDQIDHINRTKDDNRIKNLRDVIQSQNGMNRSSYNGTTSQYKGVHWHKQHNKWQASIRINGKQKYLGLFYDEAEAAKTYDRAAIEHYGIYANLNFPIEDYL